jgi:hypothetical protein
VNYAQITFIWAWISKRIPEPDTKFTLLKRGYVSRVKISPYGYGKAIYIDHPNGITSVYGHCSVFKGEIDSIVRAAQLRETNYAVEIFPEKNSIK